MDSGSIITMPTRSTRWPRITTLAVFPLPSQMKACKTMVLALWRVEAGTTPASILSLNRTTKHRVQRTFRKQVQKSEGKSAIITLLKLRTKERARATITLKCSTSYQRSSSSRALTSRIKYCQTLRSRSRIRTTIQTLITTAQTILEHQIYLKQAL